ncbi:MAG: hypothetical protein ACMXX7_02140 [Candidatus Woesearchaeota archaeon]
MIKELLIPLSLLGSPDADLLEKKNLEYQSSKNKIEVVDEKQDLEAQRRSGWNINSSLSIGPQSEYFARGADFNSTNDGPTMFVMPSISGTIPGTGLDFYALGINSAAAGTVKDPMYKNIENTLITGLSTSIKDFNISANYSNIWLGEDYDNMFVSEAGASISKSFENGPDLSLSVTKGLKNAEGYISQLSVGQGFEMLGKDFYGNATLTRDDGFFGGHEFRSLDVGLGTSILETDSFNLGANVNYNIGLTGSFNFNN